MDPQTLYLERYESQLTEQLLRLCTETGALNGQLLETPDLEMVWEAVAQPYVADAVPEIPQYPTVAIGWMGFVGMALAHLWEPGWAPCAQHPEYVSLVQRCAEAALDAIRHEKIEPQSPLAFHAYVRSLHVLYRIGAALELRRMGYHFEKVD